MLQKESADDQENLLSRGQIPGDALRLDPCLACRLPQRDNSVDPQKLYESSPKTSPPPLYSFNVICLLWIELLVAAACSQVPPTLLSPSLFSPFRFGRAPIHFFSFHSAASSHPPVCLLFHSSRPPFLISPSSSSASISLSASAAHRYLSVPREGGRRTGEGRQAKSAPPLCRSR